MKINKVMIAGVDNDTNIKELETLTEDYPFVEWGVLFSKHRAGEKRYPDKKWIDEFVSAKIGRPSAHFCGAYPREILEKGDFSEVKVLSKVFDSIQLNYNFDRSKGWKWTNLGDLKFFSFDIILQYNKANSKFFEGKNFTDRFRFLYDASGGRGTEIKNIQKPSWNNYTGYAGGLNKNNIVSIAREIKKIDSDVICWLDLESGARNKYNSFSIKKTSRILQRAEPYISMK